MNARFFSGARLLLWVTLVPAGLVTADPEPGSMLSIALSNQPPELAIFLSLKAPGWTYCQFEWAGEITDRVAWAPLARARLTDGTATHFDKITPQFASRYYRARRIETICPPSVHIVNPVNGEWAPIPATVVISVEAVDYGGAVSKVEFLAGETVLGEAVSPPFDFVWADAPAGVHTLTARATDDCGDVGVSEPVKVTVEESKVVCAAALLSKYLGTPIKEIELVSATAVDWPDSAMGCPEPDVGYLPVFVPGMLINLVAGRLPYELHLGWSNVILCEPDVPRATLLGMCE